MRAAAFARLVAPLLMTGLLHGCLLGPNYERPKLDVPDTFRFAYGDAADVVNTAWWEQFEDPVLNDLVKTALQNNLNVKQAAARVDEFMGQFVSTRSALFPQASVGLNASREGASRNGPTPIPAGVSPVFNEFEAGLSGVWNIDLFGLVRRETEAARANVNAAEQAHRANILTLVASVASSYILLRSLDTQLEIAKSTTASRADSVHVFTLRRQFGQVSEMELAQSQSDYEATAATIPQLEQQIAQQEDALSVLLGSNPEPILRGRALGALAAPTVPAGMPSDLLDRRPDLLQAEQNLIAQNALIGAARALYFPQISLTGFFGSLSTQFSSLFTGPARMWSYAGAVTMPIFTGGNTYGQNKQAEARQQEALFAYQSAVQVAFQQVADALIAVQKSREQLTILDRQVNSNRTYLRLARLRYEGGYTSYLEVLDAERNLFNAELQHTQTQATTLTSVVSLYMAMGGGWVVQAERMTVPATASAQSQPQGATSQPAAQGPQ
ncbi:efflux transporter outer membrane subunit [Paraburkholderia sp. MMS20-SJTN17]|uniref:Efflux transporter outer membrane subunit n=1 Tax=Paraburkholderia translucens TaxID=2886945 RepID=A0ABS8KER9_9BURK|nr:efflux transporter outer membrane subunit [Paraburkholderia sp. MMS20-SJTN17]MCC8403228.1 efflux transporter outer membrane subunit [Paraburkholderia sp. MMS20-SJTN17]